LRCVFFVWLLVPSVSVNVFIFSNILIYTYFSYVIDLCVFCDSLFGGLIYDLFDVIVLFEGRFLIECICIIFDVTQLWRQWQLLTATHSLIVDLHTKWVCFFFHRNGLLLYFGCCRTFPKRFSFNWLIFSAIQT